MSPVFSVNVLLSHNTCKHGSHRKLCQQESVPHWLGNKTLQCTDATCLFLVSRLLCPVRQDILSETKSMAPSFLCKTQTLWKTLQSLCVSEFRTLVYHVQWVSWGKKLCCLLFDFEGYGPFHVWLQGLMMSMVNLCIYFPAAENTSISPREWLSAGW